MKPEKKKTLKWLCLGVVLYIVVIQISTFEGSFYRQEMEYVSTSNDNISNINSSPTIAADGIHGAYAAQQPYLHHPQDQNSNEYGNDNDNDNDNDPQPQIALPPEAVSFSAPDEQPQQQPQQDINDSDENININNNGSTSTSTSTIISEEDPANKWTCDWSIESLDECNQVLAHRLPPPTSPQGAAAAGMVSPTTKQRWLFFGDSTMKRPFNKSNLNRYLVEEPLIFISEGSKEDIDDNQYACWSDLLCTERHDDRCYHDRVFQVERVAEWQLPVWDNFEGPTGWAKDKPYCSDCSGCDPHFLHCLPKAGTAATNNEGRKCNLNNMVYGGYMKVEFAKDVELQTPQYRTTQENTANYLHEHFNSPQMVTDWGKPICVIGTGLYDMTLLLKTDNFHQGHFIENVNWYLMLMKDECSHIIWMANTAPSRENPR